MLMLMHGVPTKPKPCQAMAARLSMRSPHGAGGTIGRTIVRVSAAYGCLRVRTGTSAVRRGSVPGSTKRCAGRTPVSPPAGTAFRRKAGLAVVAGAGAGFTRVPAAAAAAAAAELLAASARDSDELLRRIPFTAGAGARLGSGLGLPMWLAMGAAPASSAPVPGNTRRDQALARVGTGLGLAVRAPPAVTANAFARPRAPATGVLYGWLTSSKYCARR